MEGVAQLDLPLHNAMYAEAVALEQAKNYPKALAAYDRVCLRPFLFVCPSAHHCVSDVQAVEAVSPNGVLSIKEAKLALTARSRLHLQLGNYSAALKDAEDSLLDDPLYIRGLFAKAEALYAPGLGGGW
jgi:tetratricopeptide (TPR) repeat protein